MKILYLGWFYGIIVLITAYTAPAAALDTLQEKPPSAYISFGAEFTAGAYGTGTTTRSVYMPLIMTWTPDEHFDIGIEIPFLYQNNANVTTELYRNNSQQSISAKSAARYGQGGSLGGGIQYGSGGAGGMSSSGTATSHVSGAGDIILRTGAIVFHEDAAMPQVRPSVFIKFPTASESDGLGTGKFDAGAGIELTKWFGAIHLTGEACYTWQGKAEGFDLNNYLSYSGAIGYQLKTIEPMVMVKGATAPSGYSGKLLEIRARLVWTISESVAVDLFGSRGITGNSPDYGGGLAVITSF